MNASPSPISRLIRFCLEYKVVVFLLIAMLIGGGVIVAPFDWEIPGLARHPVPVDAIPDIGENQQIVFTEWMGRSPQDVEDQVTYPLTVSLLGIPGVKTVRSYSMFGFSTIYVIFDEHVDFYWSRSRLLEKLASLPANALPQGVRPALGPDATALGQVFWYTLEGRDGQGNPAGGWDLDELRTIQDWYVRYALLSVDGVSEVASVGGYLREYQVDVNPDAMRAHGVTLDEIYNAVRMSNIDVGAETIEINRVEYMIRGTGFIKNLTDLENAVVKVNNNVPLYVKNLAHVAHGPALRRGLLDKEGTEAVGGVVVVRYGENPLATIKGVRAQIERISAGLPRKTLPDGRISQVTVVPFYDRTQLIQETLGTLESAVRQQILITILVVIFMVFHLRSSILISALLPLAVLFSFIAMKMFHVDANIVALSGIAIAIGTVVDMGIILCENILRRMDEAGPERNLLEVIYEASSEVGSAVLTAVSTTIVGFLPVFTMQAAEGKLFRPLAYTKTFALFGSVVIALLIIPPMAHLLFRPGVRGRLARRLTYGGLVVLGAGALAWMPWWLAGVPIALGAWNLAAPALSPAMRRGGPWLLNGALLLAVAWLLAGDWLPLGPQPGLFRNLLFVIVVVAGLLGFFQLVQYSYGPILRWCLDHKLLFLMFPLAVVACGLMVWLGFSRLFGWLPPQVRAWPAVVALAHAFPGLGKEFMPPLDEGSYLYMPSMMPHASIAEALDVLRKQDKAIRAIPEVDVVVGKAGRAESPLDPAPTSMVETVVTYRPEYLTDRHGRRLQFRFDPDREDLFRNEAGDPVPAPDGQPYTVRGRFERDTDGALIPDPHGHPFRLWRPALDPAMNPGREAWPGIRKPDDIWDEIVRQAQVPGSTAAPRLQPIAARIVMLQSGMRAPMGIKVKGPDLETIERVGLDIERYLKEVPMVEPAAVVADRIVGKPYLEIRIDRSAIARYGIMVESVQEMIEVAVGGKWITTTVEGRQRYPVRVRYPRELRDNLEALERILIPAPDGVQVPLGQLARIEYVRGPEMIKSEDTFLVGYVLFDKRPGYAEVDVVEQAQHYLQSKLDSGEWRLPAGVTYEFAGSYENQLRAAQRLRIVLPMALLIIFLILYLQFHTISTTLLVFVGIFVAWAGGFVLIWFYNQPWFLDAVVFGVPLRELFQIHTVNLSVAVWVGFLALFGIASDDGVVIATYLDQSFARNRPTTVGSIRDAVVQAGLRRVRPCLMTTATTILALLPVLTSSGRGADIMIPMAIPTFGGMTFELITMLVVPVLYCWVKETQLRAALLGAGLAQRLSEDDARGL